MLHKVINIDIVSKNIGVVGNILNYYKFVKTIFFIWNPVLIFFNSNIDTQLITILYFGSCQVFKRYLLNNFFQIQDLLINCIL